MIRFRDAFASAYESVGGRPAADFNGRPFKVVHIVDTPDGEHDAEVLPMYGIRFDDGTVIEAWPEEVTEVRSEQGGRAPTVLIARSAGSDGAWVVFVDTDFEPDGSDGGPGLRILVNNADAYVGVAWAPFWKEEG